MGNENVVQGNLVPLVTEKERVNVPKHFASHPWYHRLEEDYFMYSIHNMDTDENPNQLVEEQSIDMMCMLDDISFMDDLPKYDQYDDDYVVEIYVYCSKQPVACFWEKES
jgi:hypothetical protein